eukprot:gene7363-8576_t
MKSKKISNFWSNIGVYGNSSATSTPTSSPNKESVVFGVHLNELFKRFTTINNVPNIVYHITSNIRLSGMAVEGIFRVPGSNTDMQILKKIYNEGKISTSEELVDRCDDIHTQASLLKLFIRELPDPLFTFALYDAFVKSHQTKDKISRLSNLKSLLNQLPLAHYSLLRHLAGLLREIANHSAVNKMTSSNLAIVFAPTVMRPQHEDTVRMIEESRHVNGVILLIIDEYEYLFNGSEFPLSLSSYMSASISPSLVATLQSQENTVAAKRTAAKFTSGSYDASSPAPSSPTIALFDDFFSAMALRSPPPPPPPSPRTPNFVFTSLDGAAPRDLSPLNQSPRVKPQQSASSQFSILLPLHQIQANQSPSSPTQHRGSHSPNLSPLPPTSPRHSLVLDENPELLRLLINKTCSMLFERELMINDAYELMQDDLIIASGDSAQRGGDHHQSGASDIAPMLSPRFLRNERNDVTSSPKLRSLLKTQLGNLTSNFMLVADNPTATTPPSLRREREPEPSALELAWTHLIALRRESGRSPDLQLMSSNDLREEKSAIKKELRDFDIRFKRDHGHMPRKNDKEVMRPLYQRYREVKTLIDSSPRMSNYNSALFNTQISYEDGGSTFESEPLDEEVYDQSTNPFNNQPQTVVQSRVSYPALNQQHATTAVSSQPTPHNSLNAVDINRLNISNGTNQNRFASNRDTQIDITVKEPEKLGDGMNSYVVYKVFTVSSMTDNPEFKKEKTVARRYSDFLWLRNVLKDTKKGVIIPPLPEKAVLNKFNKDFLEIRRRELEKFLNRIAESDSLFRATEFTTFLEGSDEAFNSAKNARPASDNMESSTILSPSTQPESKGIGKIASFFGSGISSITNMANVHSVKEIDPWFDDKKNYIIQLDSNLKNLEASVSNIIRKRRDLATALGEFCTAGLTFSSGEIAQSQDIANSIQRMTQVESNIKTGMDDLCNNETGYFEEGLNDYIRVLGSVKELLNDRLDSLLNMQNCERQVENKREKLEKAKQAKAFKEGSFTKELDEATTKFNESKLNYEKISATTKIELQRFDAKRNYEVKRILNFVIRLNLDHFLKASDSWKEFLTEQHKNGDPNFDTTKGSWGSTTI